LYADADSKVAGRVTDPSDAAVPNALILVRNTATHVERRTTTNSEGTYEIRALPVGAYSLEVSAPGFKLHTVEGLKTEVARTLVQNLQLEVGEVSQEVVVRFRATPIEAETTSVGHVIDERTVQDIPLNGRYFLDLAPLAPGSIAPAGGFSTTPMRGLGTLAINTAGNREETVNYLVNGITLNDLVFSGILYQPAISTVQEFKIDNSTFSAEYGQSSGAVVNVATRSGTKEFHAELFAFVRNDALDARNYFTFTSSQPPPFKRHQFGANFSGPIVRGKTFFFLAYEGLRQSQKVDLNSLVLSDAERTSATGAVAQLVELIPRPNFFDSSGTPRYVGSANAPVDNDQWTLDMSHIIDQRNRLHGYYGYNRSSTIEPSARGNTIPGFGHVQRPYRQFFSLAETLSIGSNRLNDTRFGFNRIASTTRPIAEINPSDFGIRGGITQSIGLPQMNIAGNALNFGGPSVFPSGRTDMTFVIGDVFSCLCGRHSLKVGGEFRQFFNDNIRVGTGAFSFPTVAAFLAGTANSFSVTLGNQNSSIVQSALGFFVQSTYKWRPGLTLELGLRYDWNLTPKENDGRFVVFDASSTSLVHIPADGEIYGQNNKNFQPRLGLVWNPFGDGKTVVRSAYAVLVDQPMTSVVLGTAANPPSAVPLAVTGATRFDNALDLAQATGLAPVSVDPGFNNAYMQSWNVNVQREIRPGLAFMTGYFGSKGTNLILRRNINQPIDGARPYTVLSSSSPILPNARIGNITQAEGTGSSSYNALWTSVTKSLSRGLQLHANYAWSKSLDYNSQSTEGIVVQNSYNLRGEWGRSGFDTRHRFVASGIYNLPFRGNRFATGWQIALIVQAQSGNPFNIVTTNNGVNGVAGTLRPDVSGPIAIFGTVERWFDTSVFTAVPRFGNLGRNVVIGPGIQNADVSIAKETMIGETMRVQFRAEIFDVFNHANFAQPGNVVGSPSFGRITSTRFPTGELGSSRQIQLGVKLRF
jgi:Carboxypeptidase regulatory-like domain/TonB dependent receptor